MTSTSTSAAPLFALVAAGLALAGCSGPPPAETAAAPAARPDVVRVSERARQDMNLQVVEVRRDKRSEAIEVNAVVAVDETRTARIGAKVEGLVVRVRHEVGDRVAAGARLAELHSHIGHDLLAAYRTALASERQRVKALDYARQAEARAQRLLEQRAASRQEVERAGTDRIAAEQELAMTRTEVSRARHDLEFFGIDPEAVGPDDSVEALPVVSPIAGTVIERLVSTGTTVTVATPLYVVSDLSHLWVVAEVNETMLPALAAGGSARVRVGAYGDEAFEGRVRQIGSIVDPTTRRVIVRIDLANADGRLKPNMFATVDLGLGEPREVLTVPSAAIQQVDGRPVVFVEAAAGEFRVQAVDAGREMNGLVEIRSGLDAGARVVAAGSFLLKSELERASFAEES
jgi:cobalt-zinc-cadmium efflux system membrane fusion protein